MKTQPHSIILPLQTRVLLVASWILLAASVLFFWFTQFSNVCFPWIVGFFIFGWIYSTEPFTPKGQTASKRASYRAVALAGPIIVVCLIILLFPRVFDPINRLETRYGAVEELIDHIVTTIGVVLIIILDFRRINWRNSGPSSPAQPQE